jgi:hypothetical protein
LPKHAATKPTSPITANIVAATPVDDKANLGDLVNNAADVATLAAESITTIPRMTHPTVETAPTHLEDMFRIFSDKISDKLLSDLSIILSDFKEFKSATNTRLGVLTEHSTRHDARLSTLSTQKQQASNIISTNVLTLWRITC